MDGANNIILRLWVQESIQKRDTRLQNGAESVMRVIAGVVGRLSGHYNDGVVEGIDVIKNCESEHKESAIFSLTTY